MLRPKEVVCKWVDAFNNIVVEAIVSLYHDNATNHQVTNDPVIGIDAIRTKQIFLLTESLYLVRKFLHLSFLL